jgi:hypothetical protein
MYRLAIVPPGAIATRVAPAMTLREFPWPLRKLR